MISQSSDGGISVSLFVTLIYLSYGRLSIPSSVSVVERISRQMVYVR